METLGLEQLWPELFDGMDAGQRHDVVAAFDDGGDPSYEDVKDLCELAIGAINESEYGDRSLRLAQQMRHDVDIVDAA